MMMSMGVEHDGRSQTGSRRGKAPKRSWATTIVFTLLAVFFVVPLLSPQVRWELYARYHAYASTTGRLPSFVPSAAANASRDDADDDFDYAGSCQMDMEFLSSHADGRKLIVSWANYAYYDFVLNWAWHLRKLDVNNFVVGAMDEHTYASLKVRTTRAPRRSLPPHTHTHTRRGRQPFRQYPENHTRPMDGCARR